jgi:predicted amidophosphoribosyltransferase
MIFSLFSCLSCHTKPTDFLHPLCSRCVEGLIRCPPLCPSCWTPHSTNRSADSPELLRCEILSVSKKAFHLSSLTGVYSSQGGTHEILKIWKKIGTSRLDNQLLPGSIPALGALPSFEVIVPVPQSPKRKKEFRSGGSADRVAQWLGRITGKTVRFSALETENQSIFNSLRFSSRARKKARGMLKHEERWETPLTFHPGLELRELRSSRILLVDDFVTTGRTLGACSDVLRNEGLVREVHGFGLGVRITHLDRIETHAE